MLGKSTHTHLIQICPPASMFRPELQRDSGARHLRNRSSKGLPPDWRLSTSQREATGGE